MVVSHYCGISWRQRGNATGHCAGCHRTFSGVSTFDAHQSVVNGRNVCTDPATLVRKDGSPRFHLRHDGHTDAWHAIPTAAQRAALDKLRSKR